MKIRTRIFLTIALLAALGIYYFARWAADELRPRYLEAMEEVLVDTAESLAALAGEEVIISSHGNPQVRLVPCAAAEGLQRPGALAAALPDGLAARVGAAFNEAVDQQVAQLFNT